MHLSGLKMNGKTIATVKKITGTFTRAYTKLREIREIYYCWELTNSFDHQRFDGVFPKKP